MSDLSTSMHALSQAGSHIEALLCVTGGLI